MFQLFPFQGGFLAGGLNLLCRLFQGRGRDQGLHLGQERFFPLVQCGFLLPGFYAVLPGNLPGFFQRFFGGVQLRLGGGFGGQRSRLRMMESAAHRARLPVLQRLGQQSGLGVQEGPVCVAVDELGLFFPGAGLLIALLGRLQCLPGGVAVLQPLVQALDGLLLFLGPFLTLAQSFLLFRQTLGFLETFLVSFQCLVLLQNIFRKRRLLTFECLPLRLQRGDLLPFLPAICGLAGQGLQNGLAVLYLGRFPQKAFPLRFHIGEAGQLLFPVFQQAGLGLLAVLLPGLCLLPAVDLLVKGGQSGFFLGQFLILGPRRLKGGQLPAESVPLRLLVLFLLQGFLCLFHLGQQGVPVLGCSFQILPCFLGGFRLAQQSG